MARLALLPILAPSRLIRRVLAASVLLAIVAAPMASAEAVPISIFIERRDEAGGGFNYSVRASGAIIPLFGPILKSPDGQPLSFTSISGLTAAEVANRYFGLWTIDEVASPINSNPRHLEFMLNPPALDTILPDLPTIVSPLDGAVVNNVFAVDWSYPGGIQPSGRAVTWNLASPGTANSTFATPAPLPQVTITANLHGAGSEPMTIRAGSVLIGNSYLSPANFTGVFPQQAYELSAVFVHYAPPITVTVVPEPTSWVLGFASVVPLIACWRRLRWQR